MSDPIAPSLSAEQRATLRDRVLVTMRRHHTLTPQLAWGLLLLGGAVILATGLVLSVALAFVSFLLDFGFGTRGWFLLFLVGMIPLLIWQERRTRGGFFTLAPGDVDLRRERDELGEYLLERTQTHAAALLDALMWGPRAFLAGFRALRGIRETGLDLVLPDAAETLVNLLVLDRGIKIAELAPPGTEAGQLVPVLKWMEEHDWIGVSSSGDRVWVSSIAKKRLVADHGANYLPRPHGSVVMNTPPPPSEPLAE